MATTELRVTLPRLHQAQRDVLLTAARFNVLACGRRWGKSTLAVDLLTKTALHGSTGAYFAPTYKMLSEVWRTLRWTLQPVARAISEQEKRIELLTGGVLDCWSLDNPSAARGRKYQRVVIDEAAYVRNLMEAWSQVIRPTLTDLHGDAWFPSTPNGRDDFYELFRRGQSSEYPSWMAWQMPSTANPFIDPAEIEAARDDMTSTEYAQEYLAEFIAPGGAIIKREWWHYYRETPKLDRVIQVWDTAFKTQTSNDYSVCATWGRGELGYYLVDLWRGRLEFPDLKRKAVRHAEIHQPSQIYIEDAASGQSLIQELRRETRLPITPVKVDKDKVARVNAVTPLIESGRAFLPEGAIWLADFLDEHDQFPVGLHDDQVDTTSMALTQLRQSRKLVTF